MHAALSEEHDDHFKSYLAKIKRIVDLHDLHFLTMDGSYNVASLHVSVDPDLNFSKTEIIKQDVHST